MPAGLIIHYQANEVNRLEWVEANDQDDIWQ